MWLLDLMEVQFTAALACLLVDMGKRYYKVWRPYVVGLLCVGSLLFSIADLLVNWSSGLTGTIIIQPANATNDPLASLYASLYVVDKFGIFVTFTALVIGLAVAFYSLSHLDPKDKAGPFFALLLLLITSLVGVIAAGDLLTLFLFWEGMSIAAYGLVAFNKESASSLEASLKYLFLAGTGSMLALFGISLIYSVTGSIQLNDLVSLMQTNPQLGAFGLLLLVGGLGVEAAIFPLHTWLPDAYAAAPTPVSAILSGIATATGVYALIKLIQPTFISPILSSLTQLQVATSHDPAQSVQVLLVAVALLTMLIGNLGSLGQSNVRRLLAFSSIAHVGYMLAALATFSIVGVIAVLLHIWNHGLAKSSFFMLTGTNSKEYERSELEQMKGMMRRNGPLGGMFALSSLAMMGIPPFGMFWSELLIIQALFATQSLMFYALAVAMVFNIFLSVGYFSKVINTVVLARPDGGRIAASWRLMLAPLFLLILSLLTGFAPWLFLSRIT